MKPGMLILLCALAMRAATCTLIQQDPITASDIAASERAFATLPADTAVAPAPLPGARRVVRAVELSAFARNHGVEATPAEDLCFEWPMEALNQELVLQAMHDSWPDPETGFEILETSRYPVPRGRIEFRREDLGAGRGPVMWRGSVVYGGGRRFSIWARVQAGALPPEINRGEQVAVQVQSGTIHLAFPARSESTGRNGEIVTLRNLTSNRLFAARVDGRGRAVVDLSGGGN
jgi:hypothetical protein